MKNLEYDFKIIALYLFFAVIVGVGFLFFVVPGIIFALMFGMSLNLMADDPELDVLDVLRKSRDLMSGHKKEYFLFVLSFIGHFFAHFDHFWAVWHLFPALFPSRERQLLRSPDQTKFCERRKRIGTPGH